VISIRQDLQSESSIADKLTTGAGVVVSFMDGTNDDGAMLLSAVVYSYSSVQLGAEKHPSYSAQKSDAMLLGHGLLIKHCPWISS
jgi:hypothetical protein